MNFIPLLSVSAQLPWHLKLTTKKTQCKNLFIIDYVTWSIQVIFETDADENIY